MKAPKTTITNSSRLVKFLMESLNHLPLNLGTLSAMERKLKEDPVSPEFLGSMCDMILKFEKAYQREIASDQSKQLEALIYYTHFIWDNPLPEHLQKFKSHYKDLLMFWPYEHHRSLLNMKDPKKSSIRNRWCDSSTVALSMMNYKQNPWLLYPARDIQSEKSEFRQALGLNVDDATRSQKMGSLTTIGRDTLFNSIFAHYLFLKSNSRFCKNGRNLPVPIVEIPMRPLGQDIAAVRIRNIFKRKVAETWRLLAIDSPVLSRQNELLLSNIISETDTRHAKRLYQRACKRAYVLEEPSICHYGNIGSHLLKFKASSLLLRNI